MLAKLLLFLVLIVHQVTQTDNGDDLTFFCSSFYLIYSASDFPLLFVNRRYIYGWNSEIYYDFNECP